MTFDPLSWIPCALADLEAEGLRRTRRVGAPAGCVDFGSNDYLGLAGDPRLAEAATRAAERCGWGAGASPAISGRSEIHEQLEARLAEFEGAEAAMLFPSGFAANSGVIPALVDRGDAIFADAKNHASLIDGCRLSRAERLVYPHGDTETLGTMLKESGGFRRRLVVTDTVFSMDGDFAPLDRLTELAEEHDAMLLVDEAHATGVWGAGGGGLVQQISAKRPEVEHGVAVRIGTLSKALGASGGFVTGSRALIEWLANRSRSYVFSTAMPPAAAAAALAALEIVASEPQRRERVRGLADRLRGRLRADGWDTGTSTSQIVPVYIGGPDAAVGLSERLREKGYYVPPIRPPSVPEGESLLRVSLSAAHAETEIEGLATTLQALRDEKPSS